jgi:hypothetical protein
MAHKLYNVLTIMLPASFTHSLPVMARTHAHTQNTHTLNKCPHHHAPYPLHSQPTMMTNKHCSILTTMLPVSTHSLLW